MSFRRHLRVAERTYGDKQKNINNVDRAKQLIS